MLNRTSTVPKSGTTSRLFNVLLAFVASCMVLAVAPGCDSDSENAAEDAADAIGDAAEDAKDAAEDAAEDAADAVKDATN